METACEKIITESPQIKDIDIMRDVKLLLSDIYKSVSVDQWMEKSECKDVILYQVIQIMYS